MLDWVPGHFPDDPHGLANFDGTALYEHANPMQGRHMDWGTLIYNYGRVEVVNFLLANALFWIDRYGVDGLRVDAVASMLYLDYSRPAGGWIPNKHGGRENIEAIAFLRRVNTELFGAYPQATTAAEESTAWPMVSRPVDWGGLGFGYKWNMGWMHDTLDYMSKDPIYRKHEHGKIQFGLHYAFSENFILPLSHDEVVHGQTLGARRMPGDPWQRFANLRAYLQLHDRPSRQEADVHGFGIRPGHRVGITTSACPGTCWTSPNTPASSVWCATSTSSTERRRRCMRSIATPRASNGWWRTTPPNSSFAWLRKGREPHERCVVVVNFSPQVIRRLPCAGAIGGKMARSAQFRRSDLRRQQCWERGSGLDRCEARQPGAPTCSPTPCCHLSRS